MFLGTLIFFIVNIAQAFDYSAVEIVILPQNLIVDGLNSGVLTANANSPGNIVVWQGPLGRKILLSYKMTGQLNYDVTLSPRQRSDMAELNIALSAIAKASADVQVTHVRPIRGEVPLVNANGSGTATFAQNLSFLSSPERAFFAPVPFAKIGFDVNSFNLKFHGIFPGLQGPIVTAIRGRIEEKAMTVFQKKLGEFQSDLQNKYPLIIKSHVDQILTDVNQEIKTNMAIFKANLENNLASINFKLTGTGYSTESKLAYQFRTNSNFGSSSIDQHVLPTDSRFLDKDSGAPFASVYLSSLYLEDLLNEILENKKVTIKEAIGLICNQKIEYLMMMCNFANFQQSDLLSFFASSFQKSIEILNFYNQAKIIFDDIRFPKAPLTRSERIVQVRFGEELGGEKDLVEIEMHLRLADECKLLKQLKVKTKIYENYILRIAYRAEGGSFYAFRRQSATLSAFMQKSPLKSKQIAMLTQGETDDVFSFDGTDPKANIDVAKLLLNVYRMIPRELRIPSVPLFSLPGRTVFKDLPGMANISIKIPGINNAQNYLRAGALKTSSNGYLEMNWSITNKTSATCENTPIGQACRIGDDCMYRMPVYKKPINSMIPGFSVTSVKCGETFATAIKSVQDLKKDFQSFF